MRMPSKFFLEVGSLNGQLGLPNTLTDVIGPHLLSDETFRYRVACIGEEMHELIEAHSKGELDKFADALGDLVWFILGTAHLCHIPFDEVWDEIKRANFEKRPWKEGDPVKPRNGTSFELVKPEGWKPPNIEEVLAARFRYISSLGGEE